MLDWSLYSPLLLALLVYVVLFIAASIIRSRGNNDRAERILDIGFLVALIAGAWTMVLLVFAILDEPDDIWDMVVIVVIVGVFFAVLLTVLFGLFELILTREDYVNSKPEPEPYLHAVERLSVAPAQCLVIGTPSTYSMTT